MSDKKPEWSDYAYDNDSISKRLGISEDEVKKLKNEAAARDKSQTGTTVGKTDTGIGVGASVDINDLKNSALRLGIKIPGLGIEYDTNGEGSIDIVNFIKIETVKIKCFYVQRFYFAGQFLFSDIQKVDSEECNKEPEPEPTPEPTPKPLPKRDDIKPPNEPPDPQPRGSPTKPFAGIITFLGTFTSALSMSNASGEVSSQNKAGASGVTSIYRLGLLDNPFFDVWTIITDVSGDTASLNFPSTIRVCFNKAGIETLDNYVFLSPFHYLSMGEELKRIRPKEHFPSYDSVPGGYALAWSAIGAYGNFFFFQGTEQQAFLFGDTLPYSSVSFSSGPGGWTETRKTKRWFYDKNDNYKYKYGLEEETRSNTVSYGGSTSFVERSSNQVSQFINLYDLVKNSTKNPPLPLQSETKMDEDCCKIVKKLAKIMAVDKFPASLPKSILAKTNSSGKVIEEGQVKIPDYAELFGWYIDQFDKIMGQWTVDIKVKDVDPLTPGNQEQTITLPNLAEAIAEIYGLLLQQNINSTVALNFESRTLSEAGLTRQAAIKAFRAIETIIDYIGIDVIEKEELIQHSFDPNGETLDEILGDEPEKAPIKVYEFDYKNGITLKTALQDLAVSANIIKGVFAKRLDSSDPAAMKEQIRKNVKDMEKNERILRKEADKDWDDFKAKFKSDLGDNSEIKIKDVKE